MRLILFGDCLLHSRYGLPKLRFHKGCYSSSTCSANVSVTTSVEDEFYANDQHFYYNQYYFDDDDDDFPTSLAPVVSPTRRPTQVNATAAPTALVASSTCTGFYSASNTASATQNTVNCTFTACSNQKLTISTCGQCSSDTYLRLANSTNNTQLAFNDDSCNSLCSKIVYYTQDTGCQSYTLFQGCFSSGSCFANVSIYTSVESYYDDYYCSYSNDYYSTVAPVLSPNRPPTQISAAPTAVVQSCSGFYSASNTASTTQNTPNCTFTACSNQKLTISTCGTCTSDTYLRLYSTANDIQLDSNDDSCNSSCSKIVYYTQDTGCQNYTLLFQRSMFWHCRCGYISCGGVFFKRSRQLLR